MNKFISVIAVLLITFSVNAQEKQEFKGTKLSLSAYASTEIVEDLLVANIRFETESENARDVQNKINKKMSKALAMVGQLKNITTSTGRYNVYKHYTRTKNNQPKKYTWKGQQSLTIKGKSSKEILKLVGELQDIGFALSGLNYTISSKKHEETKDSLLEEAIENLLKKANRVAKSLGKSDIQILTLNVNSDRYRPRYNKNIVLAESASIGDAMTSPTAAAGQSKISLNVSATILIKE